MGKECIRAKFLVYMCKLKELIKKLTRLILPKATHVIRATPLDYG